MSPRRSVHKTLMLASALVLLIAACGGDSVESTPTSLAGGSDEGTLTIVATTTMLGDVVSNIVGDDETVEVLMPTGADPHDFQASSQQVTLINSADLVVANGLGLEEGLHDVLDSAEADGANVIEVGPSLHPIPFGGHDHEGEDHEHEDHEHEGEDHEHEGEGEMAGSCDPGAEHDHESGDEDEEGHTHAEGSCDPHVWMDPERMAEAAHVIAHELEEVDSGGDWESRADSYADELTSANAEIEEILSGIDDPARKLVTNHEAFGYFAESYDFEIVGTVIPGGATLAEPSSAELAELVEVMTEEGVTALFTDSSAPSALAETVAAEIGSAVAVVELYSGSLGEPGSGADSLVGMLVTNAERIASALP